MGVPLGEVSTGLGPDERDMEHRGIRPQALESIGEAIAFQGPAVTRIGIGVQGRLELQLGV